MDDFDIENAWTLSGTLTTSRAADVAEALRARFPVDSTDPERECRLTIHPDTQTVDIFLRHDGWGVDSVPLDVLQMAPDARGVLRFESPYTELQEELFPQDWRFDGAGHLSMFGYHLEPDAMAQVTYDVATLSLP